MATKSKTDSAKDETKKKDLTPDEIEALSYKEWLKVKPDWTERQKKHKYFRSVYLANPIDTKYGGEPHHADRHGMLGYENNQLGKEVHTVKEGKEIKYVEVDVVGFCCNCSKSQPSLEEDYAENG